MYYNLSDVFTVAALISCTPPSAKILSFLIEWNAFPKLSSFPLHIISDSLSLHLAYILQYTSFSCCSITAIKSWNLYYNYTCETC